jgi:hypothetical protein
MLVLAAGCTVNGVRPLPTGATPSPGRAVIVYGVGVEGQWDYEGFTVQLAEYSLKEHNITGNCARFNRTEATVAASPGPVRYFAFETDPGLVVYSPFNGAPLAGPATAYAAPAGRTVYIGDFVYEADKRVSLRRDPVAPPAVLPKALPGLPPEISLAEALPVPAPRPFLCTP